MAVEIFNVKSFAKSAWKIIQRSISSVKKYTRELPFSRLTSNIGLLFSLSFFYWIYQTCPLLSILCDNIVVVYLRTVVKTYVIRTKKITPLRITWELSSTLSRSLLSFANFSGVSLLRIPRTFLKMRSFRLSGVSASRLTVEGGIQRCSVDRERISSLEGIEFFWFQLITKRERAR